MTQAGPDAAADLRTACPMCGGAPTVEVSHAFYVACPNCYDGAPDAGPQLIGVARTKAKAIEAWNDAVSDWLDDTEVAS